METVLYILLGFAVFGYLFIIIASVYLAKQERDIKAMIKKHKELNNKKKS